MMERNLTISHDLLSSMTIYMSALQKNFPYNSRNHLGSDAGVEPYKLYAYIAGGFKGIKIADLGSRFGNSALVLSAFPENHVNSYDIDASYHRQCDNAIKKSNITFHLKDVLADEELLQHELISLDVDPHNSEQEKVCFAFLKENNWKGLVLLDDIGPSWGRLHDWWNSIDLPKWDLTAYGHASGTGLVDFGMDLEVVLK
jgi:hypothetical protein